MQSHLVLEMVDGTTRVDQDVDDVRMTFAKLTWIIWPHTREVHLSQVKRVLVTVKHFRAPEDGEGLDHHRALDEADRMDVG